EAAISAFNRNDAAQAKAILNAIDLHLLDQDKQNRYKELMRTPQMQPGSAVAQASTRPDGAGVGKATDDPNAPKALPADVNFAQKVNALQEIQFQRLREEAIKAQREATESMRNKEPDRALEILNAFLDDLGRSSLDPQKAALIRRQVEDRVQQFTLARDQ